MRAYALLGAAVALASGASVQAASLTDYSVIVTGSMSISSSHPDGTVAVGGALTSNDGVFGGHAGSAVVLKVGGSVSGSKIDLNSGYMTYGGSISPATNVQPNTNPSRISQASFSVAPYTTLISGTSSYFYQQGLSAAKISRGDTSTAPTVPGVNDQMVNGPTFAASAGVDGLAVFNVSSAIFTTNKFGGQWNFTGVDHDGIGQDDTVVINVSGTNIVINNSVNFNNTGFTSHIIWNFYEAQTIDMSSMAGTFEGTVLAPNATLNISSRQINGSVYVAGLNMSNGAQIHSDYDYEGFTPSGTPPIPEAATLALILPAAAGLLMRRRKSA